MIGASETEHCQPSSDRENEIFSYTSESSIILCILSVRLGSALARGEGRCVSYRCVPDHARGTEWGTAQRTYSDAKDYIVGPMVELRLPFGLGVEADALYRPLSYAARACIGARTSSTSERVAEFGNSPFWLNIVSVFRSFIPILRLAPAFARSAELSDRVSPIRGSLEGRGLS